ncbi:dihydroorotate dehydrogenase electron transfer subunit [Hippea maritima]|uniref:Dihydroorotate dehydrogenase, electron transfer subunit, iron-sulfur cluster binding domain protein n=1 Tax=Hippea maritima (strain ATCC 700847 / DSM 10411 / MH2) TaxID=760142 RepID=F2LWV9_HIPMA|nr:dihydroorotate dehydrogenase electron transfer subunit [Hippea maritima]AEA34143.1 Dihydroorotate dehydrogenase, electron transfer subunit, iron-sulfur cluster binding domain protein [Hippea maritima DSM 10411]
MRLKIIENIEVAKNTYSLKLENPALFDVEPGQFFMVKINTYPFPLLRRPFSVADFGEHLEFIYRVVGEGTRILTTKKAGEFVDVLGPLGKGFSINSTKRLLLVGGGIGVAPLLYLKKTIEETYKISCDAYFGFNNADEIFTKDGNIATMDGSFGFKGNIVEMVEDMLDENTLVYACGPTLMLKRLAFLCFEKNSPMQVSLESRMACGIGVCLGCVVQTSDNRYKKVCVDGPVFDFEEIQWQAL